MEREIKSIQLGSAYDFIDLDNYTNNKDSIKIIFEDTGKEFTQWILTDTGTLRIESGVIDIKQYENPYEIKVIIEYEPSKLPLDLEEIDTIEGLKSNIKDLESLDYISSLRVVAYRKFGIKLNKFVLFNAMVFDEFGQEWVLEYEGIDKYNYCTPNFMTMDDFKEKGHHFYMSSGYIPGADSVCLHCKQKWNLNNLRDCIRRGDSLYHKECNNFSLYEESKKEFDYISMRVFHDYNLRAVKNEYGSESYNGCWFIINTNNGDIKVGWRKRVIEIQWLENYKEFKFNGESEDVTKEFSTKERYIHAWSVDKAIEYLKKAKKSIVNTKSL